MPDTTESLSAEDKAYFDSRGETTPAAPEPSQPGETTEIAEVEEEVTTDLAADDGATDIDATEAEEKPTGQSKVPLAALTKERTARKAEAARAAEAERKAAILEDRWNQVLLAQQQKPAEETQPAKPNLRADPIEAINKLLTDAERREQAEARHAEEAKQAESANQLWAKTMNVAREQYGAAAAADETFEPTYQALRVSIGQEFMEVFGLSEQDAIAQVNNYEAQQIAFAVDRGIDVASHMRKLAKTRNIAVQKKAPPAAADNIDKIAEGVNGSTSLSNAGGGRVATTSAQSIADMSPDEFAVWLGKPGNQDKFRKLAGG